MKNNIKFISLFLSLVFCFALTAFGQETTGNIEITIRDSTGAVVPNASVTVDSSRTGRSNTTGFRRTASTDSSGFLRILQVPPGTYRVVVAPTAGFAERTVDNVDVALGQTSPVNVEL